MCLLFFPSYCTTYLKLYRLLHSIQEVFLLSSYIPSHIHFFIYKDKVYWQGSKKPPKTASILTVPANRRDEHATLEQLWNCTATKERSPWHKQPELQGHSKLSQGLPRSVIQMSTHSAFPPALLLEFSTLDALMFQVSEIQSSCPPIGPEKWLWGMFWVNRISYHAQAASQTTDP